MALILIVEDDPTCLQLISKIVRRMGHTPLRCLHGLAAWELLEHNHDLFRLVISDLSMPYMTGDELLRRIRADARHDTLPVIIQSAYLGTRGIHDMLKLGAAAVLPKPLDLAELKLHITHLTATAAGEVVAAPRPREQRPPS